MNQHKQKIKYKDQKTFRRHQAKVQNHLEQGLKIGHYVIGKQIGKGAFSIVYEAHHAVNGELFAVKVISLQNINYNIVSLVNTQIEISRLLDHPNIIKLYDTFKDNNYLYFIMEFAKGKQLYTIIRDEGHINEIRAVKILTQLLNGIRYLHNKGIVHRDIKAENILVDKEDNVKLIDFGLSKRCYTQNQYLETFCGSAPYFSPQMLKRKRYKGHSIDVWCIGIILYLMLQGKLPFGRQQNEFLQQYIKNNVWTTKYSSPQAIKVYQRIFTTQDQRLTIKQLINCALLNKYKRQKRSNLYTSLDLQNQMEQRRNKYSIQRINKFDNFNRRKSFQEAQFQLKLSKDVDQNFIKQLKQRKKTMSPNSYELDKNIKVKQAKKISQLKKIRNHSNNNGRRQTLNNTSRQSTTELRAQTIDRLLIKKNKQMIKLHKDLQDLNVKLNKKQVEQSSKEHSSLHDQIREYNVIYPSQCNKLRNLKMITQRDRTFLKDEKIRLQNPRQKYHTNI